MKIMMMIIVLSVLIFIFIHPLDSEKITHHGDSFAIPHAKISDRHQASEINPRAFPRDL